MTVVALAHILNPAVAVPAADHGHEGITAVTAGKKSGISLAIENDDFLGVQSYTRKIFGPDGVLPPAPDAPRTQNAYEDYPMAVAHVVRKVAEDFRGDILITEIELPDTGRCTYAIEPPCTERYARWCERSAA